MNAVVIEHVPVAELPDAWRAKLMPGGEGLVTVRIELERRANLGADVGISDDPAFGIWRDREDMDDVAAYVRKLRQPRFNPGGSL
jgi:hypothetical protein